MVGFTLTLLVLLFLMTRPAQAKDGEIDILTDQQPGPCPPHITGTTSNGVDCSKLNQTIGDSRAPSPFIPGEADQISEFVDTDIDSGSNDITDV